jgi:ATP-dependent helicase HrpA
MSVTVAEFDGLRERLAATTLADADRLGRELDRLSRSPDPAHAERLSDQIAQAQLRLAARAAAVPVASYPEDLPITARIGEIADAIAAHQVVVVAGETGSGKTTQLPKICLQLGRGVRGLIGHTQPRRLAARAVAERIAEELDTELGGPTGAVGYAVRFTDRVGPATSLKLMTDGILLAELNRDRRLLAYDTLIIDEAHERSLNVDFLLGYLHQLLPTRPDLKLIITSATIDPQRFAAHFGGAPVIEVSGRGYPVEIRYRPLVADLPDPSDEPTDAESVALASEEDEDFPDETVVEAADQASAICQAVDELVDAGPGDILVFCSGEREIRDAADALAETGAGRRGGGAFEVLPLYARLSAAEQHRVFAAHPGRRIVLSTNVAETSLTVPGIRSVVDTGTARISRYSRRTGVQRLPVEPVSQASAAQRAGRCGRVAPGICIRLYSRADFDSRPEFTDPEILRTNLASVILAMVSLRLGAVADFGFLDPPDSRAIRDGVALLFELGALDRPDSTHAKLTETGRRLAGIPVDPRLGRMIVEAERNGCLAEVLVITAALSVQDPRERPVEKRGSADAAHARFADPTSDFIGVLNLWRYLRDRQRELSNSAFRRLCRKEYLHVLRIREWQDLVAQLRQAVRPLGMHAGEVAGRFDTDDPDTDDADAADAAETETVAPPGPIHQSLLAGLLSNIGMRDADGREFRGPRGTRFAVFPGSALSRRPPSWVMAAELVETSRLFARTVARIDPAWLEPLAGHLVKRSYAGPHWSGKRGSVMASETVTLYGLPIVAGRMVTYGSVDPELSRELFIRHALVEGDWQTRHEFARHNRELLREIEALQDRARRHDLGIDDEVVFAFYDARIPADIVSAAHFDRWWRGARRETPALLDIPRELALGRAEAVEIADFPDEWHSGDLSLPLTYSFAPGTENDGVTVDVPLPLLTRIPEGAGAAVPGFREELVTELIRTLPKSLRRNFAPARQHARAVLAQLGAAAEPTPENIARELTRTSGVRVPSTAFDVEALPPHLRPTYRVVADSGQSLATDKDLQALRRRFAGQTRAALSGAAASVERTGLTTWTVGAIPRVVDIPGAGGTAHGYPALVDEGATVALRVLASPVEQARAMTRGTRRLLLLGMASPVAGVQRQLDNRLKLTLAANPDGGLAALIADCADAAVDEVVAALGGPAWNEAGFARLLSAARERVPGRTAELAGLVAGALAAARPARAALAALDPRRFPGTVADVREQLDGLLAPGFVASTGAGRLGSLTRYLTGITRRLEAAARDPGRDADQTVVVRELQASVDQLRAALTADDPRQPRLAELRWQLEELRISLFAQSLGTPAPVSAKRIRRSLDSLADG